MREHTSGAGTALALAFGEPIDAALFALAAERLLHAPMPFPTHVVISVSCHCGIDFTMSLFITGLAFAGDNAGEDAVGLGVLIGSGRSLLTAASVFRLWRNPNRPVLER